MEIDFLFQSFSIPILLVVIAQLSGWAEEAIPQATEDYIKIKINSNSSARLYDWFRRYIIDFIDKSIGKNIFSFRAFFRVCRNSFFCSLVLYIIASIINPPAWDDMQIYDWMRGIVMFVLEFIFFSIIIDSLAFQKSIFILEALSKQQQIRKSWRLLLFDFLFTFCMGFLKFTILLPFHSNQNDYHFSNLLSYFNKYVLPLKYLPATPGASNHLDSIPGVFFYTTFFSSLFIWIMIITCNLLNLKLLESPAFHRIVDIKTKPIKAIKFLFMVVVVILWLLINLIFYVVMPFLHQLYYYFYGL